MKTYLSAVRHAQIALGLGDPQIASMPQLEYVSKGQCKLSSQGRTTQHLPITPDILRHLRSAWGALPDHLNATMLWAAACMCFFSFLRSGEVVVPSDSAYDPAVHLSQGDVRVDNTANPQYLEVHLKVSKTDPFRLGVTVYLGRSHAKLCPVYMLYIWTPQETLCGVVRLLTQ